MNPKSNSNINNNNISINNSLNLSVSKKKLVNSKIQKILNGFGKNFKFAPIIYTLLQFSLISVISLNLHDQLLDFNQTQAQIFWVTVALVNISYFIVSCKDPGYVSYQFSSLTDNSLKTDQMGVKQSGIISILKSNNDLSHMDKNCKPRLVDIDSKNLTVSSQDDPRPSSRRPQRVSKRKSQFQKKQQQLNISPQKQANQIQNKLAQQNDQNNQKNQNQNQNQNQYQNTVTLQNVENFTLSDQSNNNNGKLNINKLKKKNDQNNLGSQDSQNNSCYNDEYDDDIQIDTLQQQQHQKQHNNTLHQITPEKSTNNQENSDEKYHNQLDSIRSPQSRIEVENSVMSEGVEGNNANENDKKVLDFNPDEKDEDEPEFILNLEDYKKNSLEKQYSNEQDLAILNSAVSNYMNSAIGLQKGQINFSSQENYTPTKQNKKYNLQQDEKQQYSSNFAKLFTQQMTTQDTVNMQTKLNQYEQQNNGQSQLNTDQDQQAPVISREKINLAEHYKKQIQQQQNQNQNQNIIINNNNNNSQLPYIDSNLPTHQKMNDSDQSRNKYNISLNLNTKINININSINNNINNKNQNNENFINDNNSQKISINQPEEIYLEKRYCQKCQIDQPVRSKHCNECKKCIATHDHHCPWVGNCIGEKNRFPFWWFLLFQLIELCYPFVPFIKQTAANYKNNIGILDNPIIGIIVILLLGFFIFMVGVLFLFHTYLAFNNLTTWENASWDKISYLQEFPEEQGSPFSEGYLNNLKFYCTWRSKSKSIKIWRIFRKNLSDK